MPPLETGPDPFDPASLRLPPDFSAASRVKPALLTVPVKKPNREWFVRTHPDPAYQLQTAVIEIQHPAEMYLVRQDLWEALSGESTFTTKLLILAVNRQRDAFFWPIRLPDASGRVDNWSQSALAAAQLAMQRWVRISSNMSLGAYSVLYADYDAEPCGPSARCMNSSGSPFRVAISRRSIMSSCGNSAGKSEYGGLPTLLSSGLAGGL